MTTTTLPDQKTGIAIGEFWETSMDNLDDLWQVVLWNDDVNSFSLVIMALQKTFGHSRQMAEKIAHEAHSKGKAIAEVESKEKAQLHKDQLQSYGLTVEIEKI